MRTFIAVEVPNDIQEKVMEYVDSIKGMFDRDAIKWVSNENLHFTIKFLGDVPRGKIETLKSCVETVAHDFDKFSLGISHPGFFPNEHKPRVLWLGTDGGADVMLEIFQDLEAKCEDGGFDRDSKPFSPHLTLGRVRRNHKIQINELLPHFEPCAFEVTELAVMKSTLTPNGPVYERVATYSLDG